jgi:hypothetical protein
MKTSKKVKLPFKKAYSWVKQRFFLLRYWTMSHTTNRRHVINISKTSKEYKWGWIDADFRLELACMEILCDFIENEDPEVGKYDWSEEDPTLKNQIAAEQEIRLIYEWWQKEKNNISFGSDDEYKKMNEMLIRLIKVRSRMWT